MEVPMREQSTPRITTQGEAVERLIAWQQERSGVPTIPASGDTIETEKGWAFFNATGYLGTVTPDGDVIEEPGMDPDGEGDEGDE
jgi:hypothetical protein